MGSLNPEGWQPTCMRESYNGVEPDGGAAGVGDCLQDWQLPSSTSGLVKPAGQDRNMKQNETP
jgi:hypothetical protein